jgi:hypothetical protein
VAKQRANFAGISADLKGFAVGHDRGAGGFSLLAKGNRNSRVGSAHPHADSVLLS